MDMTLDEVRALAGRALVMHGMASAEATIIVDHLLDAELRGRTPHGLMRLPRILKECSTSRSHPIAITRESQVSALLDGGDQNGILVAQRAMTIAIEKCQSSGIGIVGGFNCTGIGLAGYYARQALPFHFIGYATANSNARVAPYGSKQRILGTNPLAIAIRAERDEIVSDFSTSMLTYGDVILAQKTSTLLDNAGLIDEDGYPTRDPWCLDHGAILPAAGHKGSALSIALEVIAGPLVSAKAGLKAVSGSWGFMVGAVDPEMFVSTKVFEMQVQALIDEIRQAPCAPGFTDVKIPGERSYEIYIQSLAKGTVAVPSLVVEEILAALGEATVDHE